MKGTYYTLEDMAEKLNTSVNVIKVRLFRQKIKPVTSKSLYDESAYKAICNTLGKGRPPLKKTNKRRGNLIYE
ncbi:MAG: hypothetical protein FWH41_09470 [Treponema sp.]|nr:hypothetical protein [Treponema sp.]MCL2139739.1 hypothetical protein [Treponema sp.]